MTIFSEQVGTVSIFSEQVGTVSIKDLIDTKPNFKIPSYQRGYRWERRHVEALIRDLASLKDGDNYCLQPIVIQEIEENTYRIVDGQQRLTTLAILLGDAGKTPWSIEEEEGTSQSAISRLCMTSTALCRNDHAGDIQGINQKLNRIVFIYYKLGPKEDGAAVFERLNAGKIALTGSELIRALYFSHNKDEQAYYEVAAEWERIEQRLREDDFWYMFNDKLSDTYTRIDRLFEIVTEKENKDDPYAAYQRIEHEYENKKENREHVLMEWWYRILNLFWMLEACYRDVELYNYIGWIRHFRGAQFKTLYELYEEEPANFKQHLRQIICNQKDKHETNISGLYGLNDVLNTYNYESGTGTLRSLFVLFNIETLNEMGERFPFKGYDSTSWDIEHIDSYTQNPMTEVSDQLEWAMDTLLELPKPSEQEGMAQEKQVRPQWSEELLQWVLDQPDPTGERKQKLKNSGYDVEYHRQHKEFIEIYKAITSGKTLIQAEDKNSLNNLTLLDSTTNRSYHNHIFPIKRRTVIENTNHHLILPCTRRVFVKYYTKSATNITEWQQEDATDYGNALNETLGKLLEQANGVEAEGEK